jgi:hypothetical protein
MDDLVTRYFDKKAAIKLTLALGIPEGIISVI